MIKNIKRKFIGFLSLTVMMGGISSCSEADVNGPDTSNPAGGSLFTLDFMLEQDNLTRAEGEYDGAVTGVISTGSLVDMLVFAIYDKDGKLLTEFSKSDYASVSIDGNTFKAGNGQNIIPCKEKKASASIVGLTQGETYSIAAWAQSSRCNAYDFSNLENVKISYKDAEGKNYLNNDESRDAFCTSVEFTVPMETSGSLSVVLKRPFAQINVGTTGADYKNSALTPGGTYYTYSSIEIKKVSNAINVLTNEIGAGTETVIYEYAQLPAFYNMTLPATPDKLVQADGEQFLKIHLNDTKDNSTDLFASYLTSYPTVEKDAQGNIKKYLTETFKYLSMCYVLVPASGNTQTTLDNVRVSFSNDPTGGLYETYFEVSNIPVSRNFRTNILGGLYAPNKNPGGPDDPDNPDNPDPDSPDPSDPVDDPSSVFNNISCNVMIVTTYNNSDNNYQKDENNQNGFSDIN